MQRLQRGIFAPIAGFQGLPPIRGGAWLIQNIACDAEQCCEGTASSAGSRYYLRGSFARSVENPIGEIPC